MNNMLNNPRLSVSQEAPYDPLQSFMRFNHIALEGKKEGSLSGLVFAVKDVFKIVGSTYSNGHPTWLDTHEPDDFTSSFIVNMLNAGADLVGKTICDELYYSISGENWHYGSAINPHDPRRLTGGSSGGTGAATAGGLVDFAFGSDCLGSVRVPASYNGLLGIRPTYQRVKNDGEAPYCASMDVLGYVAARPDIFERVSQEILGEDTQKPKYKKLLIAQDCFDAVDADVSEAFQEAISFIGDKVGSVESVIVAPEGLDKWVKIFQVVQGYEVWESYGGWVKKYNPTLPPGQKQRLEAASKISLQAYLDAKEEMNRIKKHIEKLLPTDCIMILPTAASVAPLKSDSLEEITANRLQSSSLLCISPLAGVPQVTLPLCTMEDVPLGISLIGTEGTDMTLVSFSTQVTREFIK